MFVSGANYTKELAAWQAYHKKLGGTRKMKSRSWNMNALQFGARHVVSLELQKMKSPRRQINI